jgi:hypothetical protein
MILLFAILHALYDAPAQQAVQQTADHALDVATLGFFGIVATVVGTVIVALVNKGRQDRVSQKSDNALNKVTSLEGALVSMAQEVSKLREAAKRRAASDRQKEIAQARWKRDVEAHGKAQDVRLAEQESRISELETYISQVDGVLSGAPDDTTIGELRPQLPVKPSMRRSTRKEKEKEVSE